MSIGGYTNVRKSTSFSCVNEHFISLSDPTVFQYRMFNFHFTRFNRFDVFEFFFSVSIFQFTFT